MARKRRQTVGGTLIVLIVALSLSGCAAWGLQRHVQPEAGPSTSPSNRPLDPTRAYFFGDSWTAGYSASPDQGFPNVTASILGWVPVIDGRGGTGYVNPGQTPGAAASYPERAGALPVNLSIDVVIVQGGINDELASTKYLGRAIQRTVSLLRNRFPKAKIVILGPAPIHLPLEKRLENIDLTLRSVAEADGLAYVSPIAENWITADNALKLIDQRTYHPNNAGHQLLGRRLSKDLKQMKLAR